MTLSDIQEHGITNEEMDIIYEWMDGLSDFCEAYPSGWIIEWDGAYGRHRDWYETEAEAEVALDAHNKRQLALLPEARAELARRKAAKLAEAEAKAAKKRQLREAKTLGGQHPELADLLAQMRNNWRASA